MTKILSVGGSIIAPDKPDSVFLSEFVTFLNTNPLND